MTKKNEKIVGRYCAYKMSTYLYRNFATYIGRFHPTWKIEDELVY
jgi:hypothetical protein